MDLNLLLDMYGGMMNTFARLHSYDYYRDNHDGIVHCIYFVSSASCMSYITLDSWAPQDLPFRLGRHSFAAPNIRGARICGAEVMRFGPDLDENAFRNGLELAVIGVEDCTQTYASNPTAFYINLLSSGNWVNRHTALTELNVLCVETIDPALKQIVQSIVNNPLEFEAVRKVGKLFLDTR